MCRTVTVYPGYQRDGIKVTRKQQRQAQDNWEDRTRLVGWMPHPKGILVYGYGDSHAEIITPEMLQRMVEMMKVTHG